MARIVAGTLRKRAQGYRNLGAAHRVLPAVVLSHPKLQILRGRNHDDRERIWPLRDAPPALKTLDEGYQGASLGVARVPVITYLDDLPKPAGKPKLGGYTIESRLAGAGQEQAWLATDSTGEAVILKCYPTAALAAHGDPDDFMRREYVAVNRVADLGRTWRAYPPFPDDSGELFVVPVVPPRGGSTLHASVHDRVPERPDGKLEDNLARAITIDAFRALQDIHDAGLVHRALHPKRVWLHQKRRVMFSDLNLARIEGDVSIALWATDGDMSEDFRAPECAPSLGLATTKSDVYSLALCLAYWLLGKDVTELTHEVIAAELLVAISVGGTANHGARALGGRPSGCALRRRSTPTSAPGTRGDPGGHTGRCVQRRWADRRPLRDSPTSWVAAASQRRGRCTTVSASYHW